MCNGEFFMLITFKVRLQVWCDEPGNMAICEE
jgi:hypothetical protein